MSELHANRFNIIGIDVDNTVVRCNTQEEANCLLEFLVSKGVWSKDQIRTLKRFWTRYGSSTCYHLARASWCYEAYYAEEYPHYNIVDFYDIYSGSQENSVRDVAYGYDQLFS